LLGGPLLGPTLAKPYRRTELSRPRRRYKNSRPRIPASKSSGPKVAWSCHKAIRTIRNTHDNVINAPTIASNQKRAFMA